MERKYKIVGELVEIYFKDKIVEIKETHKTKYWIFVDSYYQHYDAEIETKLVELYDKNSIIRLWITVDDDGKAIADKAELYGGYHIIIHKLELFFYYSLKSHFKNLCKFIQMDYHR